MAIHDLTTTDSPDIQVETGVTLANVSAGIHYLSTATLTGAVGSLDFSGTTWKRFNVTGNLSGSFTFPPLNVEVMGTNDLQFILVVEFQQDATGGRTIPLNTLFANATAIVGVDAPDLTPNGITQVLLVAQRVAGATTYTANLPPSIDGAQVIRGTIPIARIQAGSASQAGVLQIGTGAGGAAAGNHIHPITDSKHFTFRMSDGSVLTDGDYPILSDVPYSGTIVRLTDVYTEPAASTATVFVKVDSTAVTGTTTAATDTESADADATAANTYVGRQKIALNVVTTTATMVAGTIHHTRAGSPTT